MNIQWSLQIPTEPTSRLVIVENIASTSTEDTIKDFFSFCGIIDGFDMKLVADNKQAALVLFEQESAANTATLLSQAEIDGTPLQVTYYFKTQERQVTTATAAAVETVTLDKVETNASKSNSSKSVSHVMAELLASGYVLTENVMTKGVEFDEKHGLSNKLNGYFNKMGINLTGNQKTATSDSKNQESSTNTSSTTTSSKIQNLMNSKTGLKLSGYASKVATKVSHVHEEAKRRAAEKKSQSATATTTATAATDKVTPPP